MRFWKKRLQRVAAMVCSVALVASMMPTAVFATEPETTPTTEPTSIVETTPEPSESPENTDATVTTPAPGTDADSTAAPDTGTGSTSAPEETPAGNTDDTKEPVESPEPSGEPTDAATESGEEGTETTDSTTVPGEEDTETTDSTTVPNEENVEQQVSVPQTLAAAPTADGEPETRSGPAATDSEKGNEYITVYYNHSATAADNRTLTVKVQDETGASLCDDLTISDATLTTMTRVTIDQSKYAAYKIQSYELNGGGWITQIPGSLNNDQNKTFTLNAITNDSVLVVTLQSVQNEIIDLTDSKAGGKSFGSILYKEDESVSQTTNVHIYLNNEFVTTVKDLKLPSDVAGVAAGNDDSFVLTLNDGYYFAPYDVDGTVEVCTASTVSSEQHITWCKDTRNGLYSYLNYSLPDAGGTNDITLNFFTYEEGVRADFTRYVNGDPVYASGGGVSAACEKLHINYTYNGTEYNMVYDTWGLAQTIFLPRGTYIYVEPVIKDGFSFVYWLSEDSWTKGNSLYSVLPDGSLEQEETGLTDEQKGLVALTQTMALYYDADGYTRAQIGLHMTDGGRPGMYNEVYYHSNYPVEAGKENERETAYYYPTMDYGTRIENCMFSVEGYTFAGWNTQEDGKGTPYTAGQYFHDDLGKDLTLYAQWKKIDTPPVETSVALEKTILSVERDGKVFELGNGEMLKVGDVVTYQIKVTNDGDTNLSNVTVTDTFNGAGGLSFGIVGNGSIKMNDNGFTWTSDVTLTPGESNTLTYTYTVVDADKGNTITNTAAIDGEDPTDDGKTETEVEDPDVTVTKSLTTIIRNGKKVSVDANTELKVGDEITYQIKVENTGNVDLSDLTVTDTFNGNGTLPEVKDEKGNVVGQWDKTRGVWTYKIENLPFDDEETFTYTYTVVQLDAAETDGLTNTAAVSGGNTDPDDDTDEHEVKDDGPVTMEIADITTYMGGNAGYDGAVEDGNATKSTSLPEPGFYFTLTDDINSELSAALGHKPEEAVDLSQYITLTATDKDGITHTWSLEKYGNEHSVSMEDGIERYVYKIDNQAGAPIRVEFKNDAGDIVTNDNFSVDDALAENYTMSIYLDDVEVDSISFAIRIPKSRDDNTTVKTYYCGFEGGKTNAILTVRHTTGEAGITLAEENLETALENPDKQDDFLVEVTQEHDININEAGGAAGVDVTNNDVYLLADGIEELESEASLVQTAQEQANFESSRTEAKYLDLVDANNGNAWLTSEQQVTVYWPYPEGTDRNTNFRLFHYEGMDRDTTGTVAPNEVTIVEKTETGITFNTSSFSPFVLVWDTTQPSGGEDKPSGGDDGNNDNNNNNTNTNNQTTTVNVANQAAAPAAAPAAVSVPQTSDDMPIGALTAAAVAAAAALVGLLVVRKRRQK